jgi:hypothetical protein
MAWTYTATPFTRGPGTSQQNQRDSVRFLIGDTDEGDQQLQDSEVDGLLSGTVAQDTPVYALDPFQAAIQACVGLSAKYTRRANKSVGDLSIQWQAIAKSYRDLIPAIRRQATRYGSTPTPYSGGLSLGDMEIDQGDDDLNAPDFTVGMDDNPDTAPEINTGGAFTQVVPG